MGWKQASDRGAVGVPKERLSSAVSPSLLPSGKGTEVEDSTQEESGETALEERRPIDEEAILELGRQFRDARHPTEGRLAYARLLEGLTVENARLIRAELAHLNAKSPEFREFHYAWGEIAGREAVLHGTETPKRDLSVTLAGWARADPEGAMAWVASVEEDDGFDRDDLEYGIAHGLALTDPLAAGDYVAATAEAGDAVHAEKMLGMVAGKLLQADGPAETAAWAASLPEGSSVRAPAMRRVFEQWARSDPQSASARLAEMPASQDRDNAIHGFASQLAWEDPLSAIAWAREINDLQTQERVLVRTGRAFLKSQPQAAQEWLETAELSGETRAGILK